jgi:hypothetical protein
MRESLLISYYYTLLKKVARYSSELINWMVKLIGSFVRLYSIHRIHLIQNQWDKLMPI